jgi:hypothetical protein
LEKRYPGAVFSAEARDEYEVLADDMNKWRFKAAFIWEELKDVSERERMTAEFNAVENEIGYRAEKVMEKIGEKL